MDLRRWWRRGRHPAGKRRVVPIGTERALRANREREADVYRIEIEEVSNAIAGVTELEFGRHDALDQVAAIAAIRQSVESGKPVSI